VFRQSPAGHLLSTVNEPVSEPSSNGTPRDHRHIFLPASGKQLVLWILIENVVNHLHAIHHTLAHRPAPRPRAPTIQLIPNARTFLLFRNFSITGSNRLIV